MEYRNLSKIVRTTNLHPFYIQGNGLILIKSGEARKIDRKPINSEKKKKKRRSEIDRFNNDTCLTRVSRKNEREKEGGKLKRKKG